jgi:hypothetical protein
MTPTYLPDTYLPTYLHMTPTPYAMSAVVEQAHVIVSIMVHTLSRTIYLNAELANQLGITPNCGVFTESIATLGILAQQLGRRILPFDSLILRSIEGRGLDTAPYKDVSQVLLLLLLLLIYYYYYYYYYYYTTTTTTTNTTTTTTTYLLLLLLLLLLPLLLLLILLLLLLILLLYYYYY